MRMRQQGSIPWYCLFAFSLFLPGRVGAQSAAAARLVFAVQPSSTTAASAIDPPVQITVQDSSGQLMTSFTGEVTIAITHGTGNEDAELSGTMTVAALVGVATFPDLRIDEVGIGYTLTVSASGCASATSVGFDIMGTKTPETTQVAANTDAANTDPAPPTPSTTPSAGIHLVFTQQPSAVAAGEAITPSVTVTLVDSGGAPVASFAGTVTIAITDETGNSESELIGKEMVTAVAGVAVFTGLGIDSAGTGYTLTATSEGMADAVSSAFDVAAGEVRRVALRVGEEREAVTLDGRLDEVVWSTADSIVNLVTIEPEEGAVPAGQTTVKVLVSPSEIVFGFMCHDSNPAGIVAFAKTRDFDLELEDNVLIVIDPFQDGRSGYVFAVNPNGARFDGLVSAQGEEVNTDWDAIWEAATSRDSRGWSVEIRIPIKSLSFKQGLGEWGFNVERRVQRLLELSRWAEANRDYEIYQTSHVGLLTNLPAFDLGLGLSIRPGLVGDASKPAPDEDRTFDSQLSLDATKRVGPNLVASLTVNTDFAETEVDARQTNLTRFDLLFPEKRTFFLEGADIFEFGLGTDEDVIPFHTRRIGLQGAEEDEVEIPIRVGGKLNGRIGNTNIGALAVHTGEVDSLPTSATMGVVRVKQNVLDESSVGMIATVGDPLGTPGSMMGGVDFTYQTSAFRGDKNLLVGVWGLRNHNDNIGTDHAFGGMIDYPNDLVDVAIHYKHIGENFSPSLSFVPRTGVQIVQIETGYNPRPSWPLVRQMFFEFNPSIVTDLDGKWESYDAPIKPLDWQLESGDRFEFDIEPQGDRPTEDFDVFSSDASTVTVPAGDYRWIRYTVQAAAAAKRRFNGEASWSTGSFYGGTLHSLELTLRMKPSAFLTAELGLERNSGKLPGGDFEQRLYSGRVQVNVSADLQIASFVQYDNESRSLGTNSRMRWTFNPLGDLFVVFNHNMLRDITDRFHFDSNQLLIKLQYAYRL
jgi:hypothetical protein